MKRRDFIKSSSVVGSSGLLYACGGRTITAMKVPQQGSILSISKSAIKKGQLLVAHPNERYPIAIAQLGDGSYTACLMKCTHQQCETAPDESGYICPCHGARYDKHGKVIKGPAENNLTRFKLRDQGDELQLELT